MLCRSYNMRSVSAMVRDRPLRRPRGPSKGATIAGSASPLILFYLGKASKPREVWNLDAPRGFAARTSPPIHSNSFQALGISAEDQRHEKIVAARKETKI